jgi:hypothetical protein
MRACVGRASVTVIENVPLSSDEQFLLLLAATEGGWSSDELAGLLAVV